MLRFAHAPFAHPPSRRCALVRAAVRAKVHRERRGLRHGARPPGRFISAQPEDEAGPKRQILLSYPFEMGVFQASVKLWSKIVSDVQTVSEDQIKSMFTFASLDVFCERLSALGLGIFRCLRPLSWCGLHAAVSLRSPAHLIGLCSGLGRASSGCKVTERWALQACSISTGVLLTFHVSDRSTTKTSTSLCPWLILFFHWNTPRYTSGGRWEGGQSSAGGSCIRTWRHIGMLPMTPCLSPSVSSASPPP